MVAAHGSFKQACLGLESASALGAVQCGGVVCLTTGVMQGSEQSGWSAFARAAERECPETRSMLLLRSCHCVPAVCSGAVAALVLGGHERERESITGP